MSESVQARIVEVRRKQQDVNSYVEAIIEEMSRKQQQVELENSESQAKLEEEIHRLTTQNRSLQIQLEETTLEFSRSSFGFEKTIQQLQTALMVCDQKTGNCNALPEPEKPNESGNIICESEQNSLHMDAVVSEPSIQSISFPIAETGQQYPDQDSEEVNQDFVTWTEDEEVYNDFVAWSDEVHREREARAFHSQQEAMRTTFLGTLRSFGIAGPDTLM